MKVNFEHNKNNKLFKYKKFKTLNNFKYKKFYWENEEQG